MPPQMGHGAARASFKHVHALLSSFVFTTWGVCILAALDSSVIFFLPFAVDFGVVFLAARNPEFFWVYAILVSAMSLLGAATTFYIGNRLGEAGLEGGEVEHRVWIGHDERGYSEHHREREPA